MKKVTPILAVLLLLAAIVPAQAQGRKIIYLQNYEKAPYHFGFLLGGNFMGYSINTVENYQNTDFEASYLPAPNPYDPNNLDLFSGFSDSLVNHFNVNKVESDRIFRNFGFSVGMVNDLGIGRYCNLRFIPTLSFGWRKVLYDVTLYDGSNTEIPHIGNPNSEDKLCTYAELPLHLKYRSKRYNNVGAYLFGGVNPKFYLFSKQKAYGTSSANTTAAAPKYLLPKRFDLALEIGAGYDIYNQWFKMGIEIKAAFGMVNLLRDDVIYQEFLFQAPINKLTSRQLQLSLTFE